MRGFVAIAVIASLAGCSNDLGFKVKGDGIFEPLTFEIASQARGATLFSSRGDAHCVLCHTHQRSDAPFQGDLGPDLSTITDRLTAAQIRLRIVDYERVAQNTTMPSYFRTHNLNQTDPAYKGKTVLTALEIEDIIAFLLSDDDNAQN